MAIPKIKIAHSSKLLSHSGTRYLSLISRTPTRFRIKEHSVAPEGDGSTDATNNDDKNVPNTPRDREISGLKTSKVTDIIKDMMTKVVKVPIDYSILIKFCIVFV